MKMELGDGDLVELFRALQEPDVPAGLLEQALDRRPPSQPVLYYTAFELPVSRLFVAYDDAVRFSQVGGHAVGFETVMDELGWDAVRGDAPRDLKAAVEALAEGASRFDYPVDLERVASFQRRVLTAIREIPRGQIRSYGWVAQAIGSPAAVRAVGTALARNPIPVIIPCHRVVRSDHLLGEYSGGGSAVKARILQWEGVGVTARGDRYLVN